MVRPAQYRLRLPWQLLRGRAAARVLLIVSGGRAYRRMCEGELTVQTTGVVVVRADFLSEIGGGYFV